MNDPPETGVDCGGGTCPACEPGSPCTLDLDCEHQACAHNGDGVLGVCEPLTCVDEEANGTETDRDCGGPDCKKRCQPGDDCRTNSDCDSELCQDGKCVPVDCDPISGACGTADCFCANGRDCTTHEDCASGNCGGGTCAAGPRVFSRNDEPRAGDVETPAIRQAFIVENDAPSSLPLGELSLRYFYTSDGATDQNARCDESRAVPADACRGVTTRLFGVSPGGPFVDGYFEVRLADGELGPGAQTGEIPITVEPAADERYEQSSDYSFVANSSFAANTKVTLYRRGVLIWGTEPAGAIGTTTVR